MGWLLVLGRCFGCQSISPPCLPMDRKRNKQNKSESRTSCCVQAPKLSYIEADCSSRLAAKPSSSGASGPSLPSC